MPRKARAAPALPPWAFPLIQNPGPWIVAGGLGVAVLVSERAGDLVSSGYTAARDGIKAGAMDLAARQRAHFEQAKEIVSAGKTTVAVSGPTYEAPIYQAPTFTPPTFTPPSYEAPNYASSLPAGVATSTEVPITAPPLSTRPTSTLDAFPTNRDAAEAYYNHQNGRINLVAQHGLDWWKAFDAEMQALGPELTLYEFEFQALPYDRSGTVAPRVVQLLVDHAELIPLAEQREPEIAREAQRQVAPSLMDRVRKRLKELLGWMGISDDEISGLTTDTNWGIAPGEIPYPTGVGVGIVIGHLAGLLVKHGIATVLVRAPVTIAAALERFIEVIFGLPPDFFQERERLTKIEDVLLAIAAGHPLPAYAISRTRKPNLMERFYHALTGRYLLSDPRNPANYS